MKEINLVPDVKLDMIKAIKTRNLVLFICIAVTVVSAAFILILLGIKGGQDIVLSKQDKTLETMSQKLNEYSELDEFLTIQDQLGKLGDISSNKKVLSRVFDVLDGILPRGEDKVALSELTINLDENTLFFEGQADAGREPLIDYRVLEAFKKNVGLIRYDYGNFVDEEGNQIPAHCVSDHDENNVLLKDKNGYYGMWYKGVKGCDPKNSDQGSNSISDRNAEKDVKIWRTPQFEEWERAGYLSDDGNISEVAHFESVCNQYVKTNSGKWTTENDSCVLAPEGMDVKSSSNGRDANESLVLRFEASIKLDENVLMFNNKHFIVVNPENQNVTDSYRQIKDMFTKPATDCDKNDKTCRSAQSEENKQ